MKERKIKFVLYTLMAATIVVGQRREIDSLRAILFSEKTDSVAAAYINELGKLYYASESPDSGIAFALTAKKFAERSHFTKCIANAYNVMGIAYWHLGNYPAAIEAENNVLKINVGLKDKTGISTAHLNLGGIYKDQGNNAKALTEYFAALKIYEEKKDVKGTAGAHNNIGSLYTAIGNHELALKEHRTALAMRVSVNDLKGAAASHLNIGIVLKDLGKDGEAMTEFEAAMAIHLQTGNRLGMASVLNSIAAIHYNRGDYDQSIKITTRVHSMYEELKFLPGIVSSSANIANNFLALKKVDKARLWLKRSIHLALQSGYTEQLSNNYHLLSQADSAGGDYESAFLNYKEHVRWRDSIINETNTKKIVQTQMQYEFDKKETEAKAIQAKKDAVAEEEKRRQEIIFWSVVAGLTLVILFAAFIFRALRQKQKANAEILEQKHIIEEKQKEILDSIYYARRIQKALIASELYVEKNLSRLMQK